MEILFILTELLLMLCFLLKEKTDKKIDIIGFVCTTLVLLFCYNTIVCYILTFLVIPIKLWILAIINMVFITILLISIIKNKKIQKYVFNKIDILYILLIIIILLAVAYINFGFPFNVNYISGDPAHHYLTAIKFAREDTLMPNAELDDIYGNLAVRKPVSYVNSGLLMKCFCKDLNPVDCFYIFAGFGIFTFVLIGVTMYCALKKYAKNKENTLWAFIISVICTLGYPLNSFLFGFEYLTMGLLIIAAIIDMVYYYENEILRKPYVLLIFGLLNFGLFSSYYMFVPFVYPALGIYFYIKNYQKTKKIITKEIIFVWIISLIVPFILGYIYHLAPEVYSVLIKKGSLEAPFEYSTYIVESGLAVDGFIYINVYSNIIVLLPLTIYLFIINAKENNLKKETFLALITLFSMLFIEILLLGNSLGKVSMYYLSKNYFALWIVLAFTNYKALVMISEKNKNFSRAFIGVYVVLMIVLTIFSKVKIKESNKNEDENILSIMEIFGANKTLLTCKTPEFNQKELEIINYAYQNLDYDSRIEVVADHRAYYWSYVLLGYTDKNDDKYIYGGGQDVLERKHFNLKNKLSNKKSVDYVICFYKSAKYYELKELLYTDFQIIYENEYGAILKYN